MSRRTKLIIALVIILLLLLLAGGLLLVGRKSAQEGGVASRASEVPSATTASKPSRLTVPLGVVATQPEGTAPEQVTDVLAFARSFAERYGSFSTQSNFENMEALYPFMNPAMTQRSAAYIADQRTKKSPGNYQGTTTRALGAQVVSGAGTDTRTVRVSTQRQESTEAQVNARVYYQDIELTMVQVESQWKVDSVEWLNNREPK